MLFKLIRKSLFQRPLRYILTGFAILVGVASVSAVFIFTDGLRTTFEELANNIESGYDIAVQPELAFGDNVFAPTVPTELANQIEEIDGVAIVQPRVVAFGAIPIDAEDELTLSPSGPNLGVHWGDGVSNLFLQEGRRPETVTEFAMDTDSFEQGVYEIGQNYRVQLPTALEEGTTFTLVGTFTFGDPDQNALVGARIVAFDLASAVELFNSGEGYTDITLLLDDGASAEAVMAEIDRLVGDQNIIVQTREEVVEVTQGQFGQILSIFQTVLLVFAAIILGVNVFLIYNVFSITLGQRIKELGLLRAVGALGSQVTKLMLGEALMLGVAATIVGIPAGMGLAWLLRAALIALGFPDESGLPLTGWTVLWAVLTGVVVTVIAAVWPSIQARRVSPMAAIRDGAALTELADRHSSRTALWFGWGGISALATLLLVDGWLPYIALPILGALLVYGMVFFLNKALSRFVLFVAGVITLVVALAGSFELAETFGLIGAGAILGLLGANQINPIFAGQVSRVLGGPPSSVIIGIVGVGFALGSLTAIGFGVYVLASGVPEGIADAMAEAGTDAARETIAAPAFVVALLLAPIAYLLLRTAWGSRGLVGQIARSNAARNPQRTATTAAALMIGVTLVTTVTVIGDSIKSSISEALSSSITSDWLLQSPTAGPQRIPFSTDAAARVEALPEVESVVSYRVAFPVAFATSENGTLTAEDFQEFLPQIVRLLSDGDDLNPQEILALQAEIGSDIQLNDAAAVDFADLDKHVDPNFIARDDSITGANRIYLVDDVAEDMGLEVGDTFSALFIDLQSEELVVAGIYTNSFVLGNRAMTIEMWNRHFPGDTDQFLTATTTSGVSSEVARAAIEAELDVDFPILDVLDKEEFAEASERQIDQTLATVNVLLGLSAFIAALGILIALALAVFERTREIGLFRAVGTTRQQTRWMIRWEGVIVAAFGGLMGLILGLALGALITSQMPEFLVTTISVPWATLFVYLVVAAITGLVAAVFPAWIAGRMDVLDSIASQ